MFNENDFFILIKSSHVDYQGCVINWYDRYSYSFLRFSLFNDITYCGIKLWLQFMIYKQSNFVISIQFWQSFPIEHHIMFPKNPFIHNTYKRHRLEMYSVITVSCSVFLSLPEHFVMRNCEIMLSRRLVGTLFAYVANTPATELWCL